MLSKFYAVKQLFFHCCAVCMSVLVNQQLRLKTPHIKSQWIQGKVWKYLEPWILVLNYLWMQSDHFKKKPWMICSINWKQEEDKRDQPSIHKKILTFSLSFTYSESWNNEPKKATRSSMLKCKTRYCHFTPQNCNGVPSQSEGMPKSFQSTERTHLLIWLHHLILFPSVSVSAISASWLFLKYFSLLPSQGFLTLLVLLGETLFSQVPAMEQTHQIQNKAISPSYAIELFHAHF